MARRDKSTSDILILMVAGILGVVMIGSFAAIVTFWFLHPDKSVADAARLIGQTLSTLVGLLAGFLAGRTEAVTSRARAEELDAETRQMETDERLHGHPGQDHQ